MSGFQKLVRLQIKLSTTTNMQALSLQHIVIIEKWYKTKHCWVIWTFLEKKKILTLTGLYANNIFFLSEIRNACYKIPLQTLKVKWWQLNSLHKRWLYKTYSFTGIIFINIPRPHSLQGIVHGFKYMRTETIQSKALLSHAYFACNIQNEN